MNLPALLGCYALGFFVIVLFCNHYVVAESKADGLKLSLSTEDGLRCVQKKDSITLGCTLSRNNVNKSTLSWSIAWRREGELIRQMSSKVFRNTTTLTSILTVYVNWPRDKVFTCFAEYYEGELSRDPAMNASVTLGMLPQRTTIHGVRYIEGSDVKVVELYWKSNEGCNYTYDLTYTIEEDPFGEQVYKINDIECYNRINDVYRVPNTTGYICKGSIKGDIQELTHYNVKVNTICGQCQMPGRIEKFQFYSLGRDHGPDQDIVVLMPLSVNKINVSVARRHVKLTWQNPKGLMKNKWYRLTYNCSGATEQEEQIVGITEKTLYKSNFLSYKPYALCTFCIRVYLEASDVSSLPFCREARLHEEKPSKPPTITCEGNECATTNDKHFRNVSITWSLPPRETWNGVLTRVVVIYQRVGNESKNRKSITERNITKGFTELTLLARNWGYLVQTAVCNKEGCSHYGNATVLSANVLHVQIKESKSDDSRNNLTLTVSLPIAFGAALIVIVVIMRVGKRSTEQIIRGNSLPSIAEPNSDYDNVTAAHTETEYDRVEEENGNVGLESIRNSQETISRV